MKNEAKKVKILIPRMRPDEEDEFVSVNNETFIIAKGVEVEVPEYVAEVVLRAREMRYANLVSQRSGYAH
ncbi:MAG: hypothetical protein IJU52_08355 [Clostridia bacterium]|nr:hypothetical protein [Clostridia bacterium]